MFGSRLISNIPVLYIYALSLYVELSAARGPGAAGWCMWQRHKGIALRKGPSGTFICAFLSLSIQHLIRLKSLDNC